MLNRTSDVLTRIVGSGDTALELAHLQVALYRIERVLTELPASARGDLAQALLEFALKRVAGRVGRS